MSNIEITVGGTFIFIMLLLVWDGLRSGANRGGEQLKKAEPLRYVNCMGGVWRLSNRNYQLFLKAVAAGKQTDLDHYGKLVVPHIDLFSTDMTAEQAQELLDGEEPEGRLAGHRDEEDEGDIDG